MIDMREDSVYVIEVWVPMGHERINEVLQIKDPKNGSKFKRLLREPNNDKIVDFLMCENLLKHLSEPSTRL